MDYPLSQRNWVCRAFGHRFGRMYEAGGVVRQTCALDGKTMPPFRKVRQEPPYDYLPDDEQPPGAM
jgi:hypothetical protein